MCAAILLRRPLLIALLGTLLATSGTARAETAEPPDDAEGPELRRDDRAQPPDEPLDAAPGEAVDFYWKEGPNYRLRPLHHAPESIAEYRGELALEGRFGVKLAVDAGGFATTGSLPSIDTSAEVRRLFVYSTGEFHLYRPFVFKVEVGLVDADPYVDSVYLGTADLPYLGTLRVGQFDAPMSFDVLTGSSSRTFMEQAAPVQALAPGQKAGLEVASFSRLHRTSWQAGLFTDGQRQDVGDASESPLRAVARLVWRPLEDLPAGRLVHLGASASWVLSSADQVRYRSRPESFLAPTLVDTDDLRAGSVFLAAGELVAQRGPTSFQAEVLGSFLRARELGDPTLSGGYAELSHFLTGEVRPYERAVGVFGRVKPGRDLAPWHGAWGAWEVKARASAVDLNGGAVNGGSMWLVGAGLNWYWSRHVRLMFEYEFGGVRGAPRAGDLQLLQARLQFVL